MIFVDALIKRRRKARVATVRRIGTATRLVALKIAVLKRKKNQQSGRPQGRVSTLTKLGSKPSQATRLKHENSHSQTSTLRPS